MEIEMSWLHVVAVVCVGLMVGVEVSVAFVINPIVDRLPGNAGLLARRDGGRMLGRAMPVWYFCSLALTAATALSHDRAATQAWIASGLLVVSIVMSIALLVPINNRAQTWTPTSAPDDWRDQI